MNSWSIGLSMKTRCRLQLTESLGTCRPVRNCFVLISILLGAVWIWWQIDQRLALEPHKCDMTTGSVTHLTKPDDGKVKVSYTNKVGNRGYFEAETVPAEKVKRAKKGSVVPVHYSKRYPKYSGLGPADHPWRNEVALFGGWVYFSIPSLAVLLLLFPRKKK